MTHVNHFASNTLWPQNAEVQSSVANLGSVRFGSEAALAATDLPKTTLPVVQSTDFGLKADDAVLSTAGTSPVLPADEVALFAIEDDVEAEEPLAPITLSDEDFQAYMKKTRTSTRNIRTVFSSVFSTRTYFQRIQDALNRDESSKVQVADIDFTKFIDSTKALTNGLGVSEDKTALTLDGIKLDETQNRRALSTIIRNLNKALLVTMYGSLETIHDGAAYSRGDFTKATENILGFLEGTIKPVKGSLPLTVSFTHLKSLVPENAASYLTYLMVTQETLGAYADANLNRWNQRILDLGASTREVSLDRVSLAERLQPMLDSIKSATTKITESTRNGFQVVTQKTSNASQVLAEKSEILGERLSNLTQPNTA